MAANYRAERYLPLETLHIAVCAFLVLSMLLDLVSLGSSLLQLELLGRAQRGETVTAEEGASNDLRESAIASLYLVVILISTIPWFWFLSRLNHNAWFLHDQPLKFTPGWMIGWYFIPFLNLVRPYESLQELWKLSGPKGPGGSGSYLIATWWLLRLASGILGQIVMRASFAPDPSIERMIALTGFQMVAGVMELVVGALAVLMIHQLYVRQSAWHERGGTSSSPAKSCPSCGETLQANATTCPLCGERIAEEVDA